MPPCDSREGVGVNHPDQRRAPRSVHHRTDTLPLYTPAHCHLLPLRRVKESIRGELRRDRIAILLSNSQFAKESNSPRLV